MYQKKGHEIPLNSWKIPENAWERTHIDFKVQVEGNMWLVIIDVYFRCLEVFHMRNATSNSIINCLHELFCHYGLDKKLVTENILFL